MARSFVYLNCSTKNCMKQAWMIGLRNVVIANAAFVFGCRARRR